MPTRIVVADDHPIVLQGLRQLFERAPGFAVVGSCLNAAEALNAVRSHRPDVLVVDLRMPDRSGLEVLRALANEGLKTRVVLLTAAVQPAQAAEAVKLGALGLVLKDSSPDALIECVRAVSRGETWLDRGTSEVGAARDPQSTRSERAAETLTPRELEIVRLIARGLRNRAISESLSISEGTVKLHLHHIYQKLDVDTRLELVLAAQQMGLV